LSANDEEPPRKKKKDRLDIVVELERRRHALKQQLDLALVKGEEEVLERRRKLIRKGASQRLEREIQLISEETERLRKAREFLMP
jgi:hypothetical protein